MLSYREDRFTDPLFPSRLAPLTREAVFFDIETTGLSPASSVVFMIGAAWRDENAQTACQWIEDDLSVEGERRLLTAFFDLLAKRRPAVLYVYNGHSFDVPFIEKRCARLGLDFSFEPFQIVDLYRELSPLRPLFPLKNFKLRSMEAFLGYKRRDKLDGKELIRRFFLWKQTKDPAVLDLLYLHNLDDLRGTVRVFSAVTYIDFFNGAFSPLDVRSGPDTLTLSLEALEAFPVPASYSLYGIDFQGEGIQARLTFPLYTEGIRYYYPNWKDYCFLTEEGYAIHKSMAAYVDRSRRVPATKEQCFTYFHPEKNFAKDTKALARLAQMAFDLFGFSGKPTFLDMFRV